jgi:hypothetical protein
MRENKETKLEPSYNWALTLAILTSPLLVLAIAEYGRAEQLRGSFFVPLMLGIGSWPLGVVLLLWFLSLLHELFGRLTLLWAPYVNALNAVPMVWIKLSWVIAGGLTAIMSVLTILGNIPSENFLQTLFVFIYVCICSIGLLCLFVQWVRNGVTVYLKSLVFFSICFTWSLSLYEITHSFLLIGFLQSLYLVASLTGKAKSKRAELTDTEIRLGWKVYSNGVELTDPLIPKLIAACALGLMLMSGLFHVFRDELITKKGAFQVLQSLPPVICLLTYWGIRAIRPYEKPPE